MSTIHFRQTTTMTPEQFVAGLAEFGPGGSENGVRRATHTRSPRGSTG
jgi:hypothetical protein